MAVKAFHDHKLQNKTTISSPNPFETKLFDKKVRGQMVFDL